MSYIRVIPRDLFNEANLLKCLGQLYIQTEKYPNVEMHFDDGGKGFEIHQSQDDGSIFAVNVYVYINNKMRPMFRPLNSRESWPLYTEIGGQGEFKVFNDDGMLSTEFLELIKETE